MTSNSAESVRVKVLFFGAARDAVGQPEVELLLDNYDTSANALAQLIDKYPTLRRFGRSLLVAVNQEYARGETTLKNGDELAVFPPVSGGSVTGKDFFELTTDSIDVGEVARRVVPPQCGATVTLDGYAREWTNGKRTQYLVYEAYETMALQELKRLGQEARQRFEITFIGIVHRTGRLEIGETSVVISVGAPHRRAAFEACEWAIRELKRTVPIWKKEVFEDGEVWVEGEATRER